MVDGWTETRNVLPRKLYICITVCICIWRHVCGCWLNLKEAEGGSISPIRLSFASIRGGSAEPGCLRLGLDRFRHQSFILTVQYMENVAHWPTDFIVSYFTHQPPNLTWSILFNHHSSDHPISISTSKKQSMGRDSLVIMIIITHQHNNKAGSTWPAADGWWLHANASLVAAPRRWQTKTKANQYRAQDVMGTDLSQFRFDLSGRSRLWLKIFSEVAVNWRREMCEQSGFMNVVIRVDAPSHRMRPIP